jgi:hypothetical protein
MQEAMMTTTMTTTPTKANRKSARETTRSHQAWRPRRAGRRKYFWEGMDIPRYQQFDYLFPEAEDDE